VQVEKRNETMTIKDSDRKFNIDNDTVLLFDMDGTLINTDLANFLAYKESIESVLGFQGKLQFNPDHRFNRSSLVVQFPNLSSVELDKIIKLKETNYLEHLERTKINKPVAEILLQYSKTHKTILVTNCRKDRAIITMDYHNLRDKFSAMIFRLDTKVDSRTNKYLNALSHFNLPPDNVVVFENENQEVEDAINAGIKMTNIYSL